MRPVAPSTPSQSILEEHPDDRHHGQSAVGQLGGQFFLLLCRVRRGDHLPTIVTWRAFLVVVGHPERTLDDAREEDDLHPTEAWHFAECSQSVGHVLERHALRRRQHTRKFIVLWDNISNGRRHRYPTMLELHAPAALERSLVVIAGETQWIPEAQGLLHSKLRGSIEGLVGWAAVPAEEVPGHHRRVRGSRLRRAAASERLAQKQARGSSGAGRN